MKYTRTFLLYSPVSEGEISATALCLHFVGVLLFSFALYPRYTFLGGRKLVTTEVARVRTDDLLM